MSTTAPTRPLSLRSTAAFVTTCAAVLRTGASVRFRAEGGSMHPAIRHGDVVTLAPVGPAPIAPGDVVAIRTGRRLLVHRVVDITLDPSGTATVVTRGDARDECDPPVSSTSVLGRVTRIERRTLASRVRDLYRRLPGIRETAGGQP